MIVEWRGEVCWREGGGCLEVIIHVKDIGQKTLRGRINLLHLVLDLYGFQAELLPRS